ncbi:protein O-glucosyltransferase 2-like [Aphis gossypii]|uniref:protein O-glucosyltransferase 2-like n=1 Tax=Aphis gossypii TaxID=80765 RepID=UPI00100E7575|nr:protein O-glucosyltransferase 2-like [Aphis gossypii]
MCTFSSISLIFLLAIFKFDGLHSADTTIWGPGLDPLIVLPARYFYVQYDQEKFNIADFNVLISGKTKNGNNCRVWTNILDRKDASFIVRYKLYEICYEFRILVENKKTLKKYWNYFDQGPIYPDECDCSKVSIDTWLSNTKCRTNIEQINNDLNQFKNVNFKTVFGKMAKFYSQHPHSTSVCHYVVKNNLIFRKCYGEYTGFKMFMDNLLLSLNRKVFLPDLEFFVNLGDWPLSSPKELFPLFSWCGSNYSVDIVMPTYDITESALENMGRVTLDMLSVQGNIEKPWSQKIEKGFWMGRDSSKHRLNLVELSKKNSDILNASITNFFFYKELKEKYGPGKKPISFFKFFDYKYLLNIDGTVAAYRFPYLLVGDSLIFKQESEYYEHFYSELIPWVHYVPVKRHLDDLLDLIDIMMSDDKTARKISLNGQKYAREHLAPHNILGYYLLLFQNYSKFLTSVEVRPNMDAVISTPNSPNQIPCQCEPEPEPSMKNIKTEL